MNPRSTIILSSLLALCAFSGHAQNAGAFGTLPLYFESGQNEFIARGAGSEFSCNANGAEISLRRDDGKTGALAMQFLGSSDTKKISGEQEQAGKINYLVGAPAQWRTGIPTFSRVAVQGIYSGINLVYYGNQRRLEYDFDLAPGANPADIAIHYDGAEKISVNADGELVVKLQDVEMVQPQPVAYQIKNARREEVKVQYKMTGNNTVAFALGNYDRSSPLVIDPVLSYSTFFGGNFGDAIHAIKLDAGGSIYVAGETLSTIFSNGIPSGSYRTNFQGGKVKGDAFVAKFDNLGTNLSYFTYIGGTNDEVALGLDVDGSGNAYITGYTDSTNFPTLNTVYTNLSGKLFHGVFPVDAFVTELNASGSGLIYSTYLGGNAADVGSGIAVDTDGTIYVAGYTLSTNFPVTDNAFQKHLACTNSQYINANAFVTAIAPGGGLNYSSYFGGTNNDEATSIAINSAHQVFITGFTSSTNFPTTNYISQQIVRTEGSNNVSTNFYDGHFLNGATNNASGSDAFVAAFTVTGPNLNLLYSTLLGGTNSDEAESITADAAGNAYVVGGTTSRNFPDTITNIPDLSSAVRTNIYFNYFLTNAFLTQIKFSTNASIGYSALFGGHGSDVAHAVAIDAAGNTFITGSATSTNFPVTTNNIFGSLRATNSGGSDVFVIAFNADVSALLYSTYLGGKANDFGYGIAVDADDNAYVVGQTLSTNFPVFNARQKIRNGTNDAFLAKISMASMPSLAAAIAGNNFTVSWPPVGEADSNSMGLETSTNMWGTNWVFTVQSPVWTNGRYVFKFNPTNPARFFRLKKY